MKTKNNLKNSKLSYQHTVILTFITKRQITLYLSKLASENYINNNIRFR